MSDRPDGIVFISKADIDAMVTTLEEKRPDMRWYGGTLQQAVTVTRYQGGKVAGKFMDWRDVPVVERTQSKET